jgi:cell division protein FtsB
VLSLQLARQHAWRPRGDPNGRVSKLSNRRPVERLKAENAQLRDTVVDLMLQIQALRDGAN